jgi:uncharacterized protein YggE
VPQAFTLVLVLLVSTPAFAQPAAESPLVVTMGEGVVHAVPDRAWITIGRKLVVKRYQNNDG